MGHPGDLTGPVRTHVPGRERGVRHVVRVSNCMMFEVSVTSPPSADAAPHGKAGARAGSEVPQVYLGMPAALNEPPKRLVGWLVVPGGS